MEEQREINKKDRKKLFWIYILSFIVLFFLINTVYSHYSDKSPIQFVSENIQEAKSSITNLIGGEEEPIEVTSIVIDKGFELKTNKVNYNCFPNSKGIIIRCQPVLINITPLDDNNHIMNITSIFPMGVDITNAYEKRYEEI